MCSHCAGDYENPDMTAGDDEAEGRYDEQETVKPHLEESRKLRLRSDAITRMVLEALR